MRRIAAALLALLAAGPLAEARQHFPARGHRILPAVSPLDAFATPAAAYSFRKLRGATPKDSVTFRGAPIVGSMFEARRDPLGFFQRVARESGDYVNVRFGPLR